MTKTQDLFKNATELAEHGHTIEALAIFQALLRTDSKNASLWNNIGIIRFRHGENREALNALGQATDIKPEFREALRTLDKVLKLNPRDKEAQSQRALIVRKMAQVGDTGKTDSHSVQSQLRV
ncbi:MAG: tetratricopeptide repeat protein [Methanoregulaceae archaeon]|jgi:Flp pilus assembly protein TadD